MTAPQILEAFVQLDDVRMVLTECKGQSERKKERKKGEIYIYIRTIRIRYIDMEKKCGEIKG